MKNLSKHEFLMYLFDMTNHPMMQYKNLTIYIQKMKIYKNDGSSINAWFWIATWGEKKTLKHKPKSQ